MPDSLNFLRYWRGSLADGLLPGFPDKAPLREVDWDEVVHGRVPDDAAQALLADWKAANSKKQSDKAPPAWVPVLIAPVTFIARHGHGTSGLRKGTPYAPLILTAQMSPEGKLSFDPSRDVPWISRSALEPSAAPEPQIGSLADFDSFRSTTPKAEDAEWAKLIDYSNKLCAAVSGIALAELAMDGYDRGPAMVVAAYQPSSPSKDLITLADSLIEQRSNLPATFQSICATGPMRPQLSEPVRWTLSARHVGQMSRDYPLVSRQREAVHLLLACNEGEILPVNGPPGTGKTTLLQSIVATMVVETALAGKDAPVIFVSSTNNQAVTNVIDSFAMVKVPPHRQNDPLEGRWIPGVKSFALFLPSKSALVDEEKYHIARLPNYGTPLSGLPADLIQGDVIEAAETAFLSAAATAFSSTFETVGVVLGELQTRLHGLADKLKRQIGLIADLQAVRVQYPGETAINFMEKVEAEAAVAEQKIAVRQQQAAAAQTQAAEAMATWKSADSTVGQALEQLYPSGGALTSLLNWLLGFLQSVRAGRWERCRRLVKRAGIEDGPFASIMVPTNFDEVRLYLDGILTRLRAHAGEIRRKAEVLAGQSVEEAARERAKLAALRQRAAAWQDQETRWAATVEDLCTASVGIASVAGLSRNDLITHPEQSEALLDVTLRHEMFLLATHYWEARWLQSARILVDGNDDPLKKLSGKMREATEVRWRLMACLTPCFVSTLFMLPQHLRYFAPEGEQKNPPLTDFVDLLIVDEAGQVPPEIGCVGLALGKKALVVGDIHQIEPVWSVGPHIDEGNISRYELREYATRLTDIGACASSGSLMRMARHASAFAGEKADPGVFLVEHRRCQTPIIQVCNELVYADRLIPRVDPLSNPIHPPLGWANVRAASGRHGTSRFNPGEAEAIAEWLGRRRGEIEARYGKKIESLVGIVTPFSAQKNVIRQALGRYGLNGDEMTVGTVHALQGAEREIVLFSPVHTAEDGGRPFFDCGPNMINVAVSRAKHCFLVFGDMRVFNPATAKSKVSSGVLAKHLFHSPDFEITDALARPDFLTEKERASTIRLDSLDAHRGTLREALEQASERVLVVSPCLSSDALVKDSVEAMIATARQRNIAITIVFDPDQNKSSGQLKPFCSDAAASLVRAGAEVVERPRTHNKTLAVDDAWIVEGSFNWLSAAREPTHPYARQERSLRYQGPGVDKFIQTAWKEIGA